MKMNTLKHAIIAVLAAGTLIFSSCVDDTIDLTKVSDNILIPGTLAVPIGEATFTLGTILDSIKVDMTDPEIGNDNGLIYIRFKDTLIYENPADVDLSSFGTIKDTLDAGTTTGFLTGGEVFPFVIPNGIKKSYTVNETYNFNDINENPSEQRIDSLVFDQTTIAVTIKSNLNLPAGFVDLNIQLPTEFTGLDTTEVIKLSPVGTQTDTTFTHNDFHVDVAAAMGSGYTTTFPIKVNFNGNGVTAIQANTYIIIDIKLNNAAFTAYGKFNYGPNVKTFTERFDVLMDDFIPDGSSIYPANPGIKFDIVSNIGVPLLFNINGFQTREADSTIVKNATFNGATTKQYTINPATTVGGTATTTIAFDKELANGRTNELFKINVHDAKADYGFGTKDTTALQFVRSDSWVKVNFEVKMPFWFDPDTKFISSDTIQDVGKDLEGILKQSDYISEACLLLRVTNKLPIGTDLKVELLDANYNVINPTRAYNYYIGSAPVDSEGSVTAATLSDVKIIFDQANMEDLKTTQHLRLTTTVKGYNLTSKIKFNINDWINVKAGAYVIGRK